MILSEKDITLILAKYRYFSQRYEIMLPNVYTKFDNEVDFIGIRKSGYIDEFEIKLSRSDFLADKKKFVLYRTPSKEEYVANFTNWEDRSSLPWYKTKLLALEDGDMSTNYFSYVVPEGLVSVDEVPSFSGLIVITEKGTVKELKEPKKLHNNKISIEEKYKIAIKASYRYWKLRGESIK